MEADLIERYFVRCGARRADVRLGIGDDAAVLAVPPGEQLVLTTDALVEGVHFLAGADPRSLGHRALAVNLSDIAAMGARPAWALLALNLPAASDAWLAPFSEGFGALAAEHEVALVGGNLSGGPLSVTVTLAGLLAAKAPIRRDGARAGDQLWVSGTLGDAAAGRQGLGSGADAAWLRRRFEFPSPRVALGPALAGLVSAGMDLSDGLAQDLGRLALASGCAARVRTEALPLSEPLCRAAGEQAWRHALSGGEDYELLLAAPAEAAQDVRAVAARCGVALSCIGECLAGTGVQYIREETVIPVTPQGFDHFGR